MSAYVSNLSVSLLLANPGVAVPSGGYPAWLNRLGKKGTHITEEYLDKIYKEWSELILSGLESGEISVVGSRDVANFLSARYDNIHTKEELAGVLNDLKVEWPMFEYLWSKFQI